MPHTFIRLHRVPQLAALLLLTLLAAQSALGQEKPATQEARQVQSGEYLGALEPGKAVERELSGGAIHVYGLTLKAGQFLNVIIEQRGIDVAVSLIGPGGQKVVEVDSPNGTQGPEPVLVITEISGNYRLEVRSPDKGAAGRYEVRMLELRPATAEDRARVSAQAERVSAQAEAVRLHQQVEKLYAEGKYREAMPLAERELAIWERTLPPDHPNLAESLNNLAEVYRAAGDYVRAEASFRRALAVFEKIYGPEHPHVAASLNNLAVLYKGNGDYSRAGTLYRRALAIREKLLGPEHPDVGVSLNNLAQLYRAQGDYAGAEPLSRRALAVFEKVLGPEHPYTAGMLNNLAVLYSDMSDYAAAEGFHQRALAIREKVLGPEHPNLAESLSNLGVWYKENGDYLRAEPLYRRALAIREKRLGPDHELVAMTLTELGVLFKEKGDYASAEPLYRRALGIREKLFGPDHTDVADSINRLALLYHDQGEDARAEPLYQRALAIEEKALGPAHPDVAAALNNLATLYDERADHARAEPSYRRALAIYEKAFGPEHPKVAAVLNNFGKMYSDKGDYARAEPLQRRALAIREKVFGPEHPVVALSLNNLAAQYMARGDLAQAVRLQTRGNDIRERHLTLLLTAGSEEQKRLYLQTLSKETDFTISLHARVAPHAPSALRLAFTTVLQRKGRVLDAMANSIRDLRRRLDPEDRALLDQLFATRSQLATILLKGAGQALPEQQQAAATTLRQEAERLEAAISARSAEFRTGTQAATFAQVQAAIPGDSALVEIAWYRPYDVGAKKTAERFGAPRYVAYVLRHEGEPSWVDLGEAAVIDRDVTALGRALSDPSLTNPTALRQLARALDEKLMRPIRRLLGGARHVLLSPDKALNLLPFGALVDERNRHLVEDYSLTYLTSGRDLLRLQVAGVGVGAPVAVADPAFDTATTTAGAHARPEGLTRGRRAAGLQDTPLPQLPATRAEAEQLKALLPETRVLLGAEATEAATKQISRPRILHIATHGFFLKSKPDTSNVENPLLRSGLFLAGANKRQSGVGEDGVLTALEVAGMDLWGTKLVVLSACETGVGEVSNGEGVYGLRRALTLAGTESQVLTLWQVQDKRTRDLMIGFYKRLQNGEGRTEALRQMQLAMLRGRGATGRHPFFWAGFIQSGDWRAINAR